MAGFIYNLNSPGVNAKTILVDALRQFNSGEQSDHSIDYYSKERAASYLGTPVFSPLLIKPGSYQTEEGETIGFDGIFLDTVLMTVSRSKIIQKTQITGRKGTVKEYIADGDFSVNIKAVIASPAPNIYPREAVERFLKILEAPISLEVTSEFLNMYGIYNLVIEQDDQVQRQAFQNVAIFDINAVSDEPLELQIANE